MQWRTSWGSLMSDHIFPSEGPSGCLTLTSNRGASPLIITSNRCKSKALHLHCRDQPLSILLLDTIHMGNCLPLSAMVCVSMSKFGELSHSSMTSACVGTGTAQRQWLIPSPLRTSMNSSKVVISVNSSTIPHHVLVILYAPSLIRSMWQWVSSLVK